MIISVFTILKVLIKEMLAPKEVIVSTFREFTLDEKEFLHRFGWILLTLLTEFLFERFKPFM